MAAEEDSMAAGEDLKAAEEGSKAAGEDSMAAEEGSMAAVEGSKGAEVRHDRIGCVRVLAYRPRRRKFEKIKESLSEMRRKKTRVGNF
jgi:hypothetical protein